MLRTIPRAAVSALVTRHTNDVPSPCISTHGCGCGGCPIGLALSQFRTPRRRPYRRRSRLRRSQPAPKRRDQERALYSRQAPTTPTDCGGPGIPMPEMSPVHWRANHRWPASQPLPELPALAACRLQTSGRPPQQLWLVDGASRTHRAPQWRAVGPARVPWLWQDPANPDRGR